MASINEEIHEKYKKENHGMYIKILKKNISSLLKKKSK